MANGKWWECKFFFSLVFHALNIKERRKQHNKKKALEKIMKGIFKQQQKG